MVSVSTEVLLGTDLVLRDFSYLFYWENNVIYSHPSTSNGPNL